MDENGWGLTALGFRRPTYTQLLDALEYKARELFGATANLTVRSPIGMFLRIYAWILNILFSLIEDVYNSRFVDTAVGTSLFNLGRAIGLQLLSAQKASGYLVITGPAGTIIPEGWLAGANGGIQFYTVTEAEIGANDTALVPARCTMTGAEGNVAAETVTVITNPGAVAGLVSVTNPAPFTGGRERETDEEFRDRYYASVDFAGGVNGDAIMDAKVFENDTDFEDEYGLPPHSIEAVVYGGLSGDIAQQIYSILAGGIQTYGEISVQVLTASQAVKVIRFNRPRPVPVYVKIFNLKTGSSFPHNGKELVRQAVVNFIGDDESGGVGIGETLYHQRLTAPLYAISGLLDFDVALGLTPEELATENIEVDSRSKVVTDSEKVSVL